jgi:two-component system sensor histidine kinase KdpD
MIDRRRVTGWVFWCTLFTISTVMLVGARDELDQSHAVLTLMLVVLGGSVAGGRLLGYTLSVMSVLTIDYFFQPPYDLVSFAKPIDFFVLVAFLAIAFVTTELLTRARQQANAADARASEVETLSRLGSETLRHAEARQTLEAIASLVRHAIDADSCAILPYDSTPRVGGEVIVADGLAASFEAGTIEHELATRAITEGRPMFVGEHGEIREHGRQDIGSPIGPDIRAHLLALPLRSEERVIGVLVVRGNADLVLDAPRRRLLAAMGYYAALGIERTRLMAEAATSEGLRESQRAKDEIFAAVSHDLRTPLTTIKVLAQSAAARGEPSSIAIAEQADRLARMVGDLLESSRLRTGSISLTPELNTADDLVGAALRQAEGILNGRAIDVQIDFDSPALVGRFDFVHTLRIVGNLLDNALRHTPPGGVVEMRAERDDRWLILTVADRGSGVKEGERERIFEAFYRPEAATPDTGHAGLGLSIARSLAEVQGGSVSYEERDGGGSLFVLRLPAADVSDDVEDVDEMAAAD